MHAVLFCGEVLSLVCFAGIANALDLTDRILPRLQARPHCRPLLLNFPPYSRQELTAIVQDRLAQVNSRARHNTLHKDLFYGTLYWFAFQRLSFQASAEGIMDASAVQFCARKVSAVSGDARKALDICRYVLLPAKSSMFLLVTTTQTFFPLSAVKLHQISSRICSSDWFCFVFRRAVEVVESDERKKASDQKAETKGGSCSDLMTLIWTSVDFCSPLVKHELTRTLLVLGRVQRRGSVSPRLRGCCRRYMATEWHLSAAALMERVSRCSRSCWSAACCCSYATERAKRSALERWGATWSCLYRRSNKSCCPGGPRCFLSTKVDVTLRDPEQESWEFAHVTKNVTSLLIFIDINEALQEIKNEVEYKQSGLNSVTKHAANQSHTPVWKNKICTG